MTHRHSHDAFHRARQEHARAPQPESEPAVLLDRSVVDVVPDNVVAAPPTRALVARSSSTCTSGDDSGTCQKPTNISSIPIVLGAVIPITIAIVVLLFLHRRHKKKLALEDLNDKHKSLDFGLGNGSPQPGKKGKKGKRDLTIDPEKSMGHGRGLSMDMTSSPYLLPAGLHQSRESFHSLSRSIHDDNDPYRPVGLSKGDDPYARSIKGETASIYTKSSVNTDTYLLRKPSFPSRGDSYANSETSSPVEMVPSPVRFPERALHSSVPSTPARTQSPLVHHQSINNSINGNLQPTQEEDSRDSYFDQNAKDMRETNNYLSSFLNGEEAKQVQHPPPPPPPPPAVLAAPTEPIMRKPVNVPKPPSPPPQVLTPQVPTPQVPLPHVAIEEKSEPAPILRPETFKSMEASVHNINTVSMISDSSDYGDGIKVTPPSPRHAGLGEPEMRRHSLDVSAPATQEQSRQLPDSLAVREPGFDPKRLSMSIRPLPIEDPTDNPEQRANRIRSFYKEYFDENRPDPVGHYAYEDYTEDYGAEYLAGNMNMYDASTGDFVYHTAPFAEPVTRRAMTPPPRAPPRFTGSSRGHYLSGSTTSGRVFPPRGMSAMSNRSAPRKALPPPSPLTSLPTPHKLKEDSMVFNPLDFAPPSTFRDRQAGRRPDSPLGTPRPYSPSVRAHVPLESPFAELAPMPSPFQLRKSGTFTALDFAPPPRFKNSDAGSDTASIRSNGSGISAVHLNNIRNGAYRVSRIPKEVVGTRDDIVASLKPKWDLVTPA